MSHNSLDYLRDSVLFVATIGEMHSAEIWHTHIYIVVVEFAYHA